MSTIAAIVTTITVSRRPIILYEAKVLRLVEGDHWEWLEKVSQGNKAWVAMVTNNAERFWAAELVKGPRKGERFIILPRCAWNRDIEAGLPIMITLAGARPKGTCRVVARLRNNKKYIEI